VKVIIVCTIVLMLVLPLTAQTDKERKIWLSGGMGYGTCGQGGRDSQGGGFLQGILQDKSITYSTHYLGFVNYNPIQISVWNTNEEISREIKRGHIIGIQLGLMPEAKAFRMACAAGVSCNRFYQGTELYPDEWKAPYKWKTTIGFPLSLDLILGVGGGVKVSAYYNYNAIAPVFMMEAGFWVSLNKQ